MSNDNDGDSVYFNFENIQRFAVIILHHDILSASTGEIANLFSLVCFPICETIEKRWLSE